MVFTPHTIAEAILGVQHIRTDMNSDLVYLYKDGYYNSTNSIPWLKKEIQRILCGLTTDAKVKEILNYIVRATYEPINKSSMKYICLNNGLLNTTSLELEPHTPDKFVTFKIPVTYNQEIGYSKFHNYVLELVSERDADVLQEGIGNILSDNYETKKLLYLYGGRDCGKSTFLRIIQALLTQENYSNLALNQLGEKFTQTAIVNKLANISSEESYRVPLKFYGLVKNVTGTDTITMQFKGKDSFSYESLAKQFFAGNGIPAINKKEADPAFYERWQFINFPNPFDKNDNIFKLYTTDVMKSAILNWMIEGYKRLRLNQWKFSYNMTDSEAEKLFDGAQYEDELWMIWLKENCVADEGFELKATLYRHYMKWCEQKMRTDLDTYDVFFKKLHKQGSIHIQDYQPEVNGRQQKALKGIMLKKGLEQWFKK
jgi:P4 family phage/plasmid primase-like protien